MMLFIFSVPGSFISPLKWSCLVVMYGFTNVDDCHGAVWNKLVQSQCAFLSVVYTGCKKDQLSAKKCFGNLLKNVSLL